MKIAIKAFLIPISMVYIALLLASLILLHKVIPIGQHLLTLGAPVIAAWFVWNDIVTEVYGYAITRKMFWSALVMVFIFYFIITLTIHLPSADGPQAQEAYLLVFGGILRIYVGVISFFIAVFVNAYLLSKWKILLRGKYFLFRSIAASFIAIIIFTSLTGIAQFSESIAPVELAWMILWGIIVKLMVVAISACPATFLASFLKQYADTEVFDKNIDYNPFKLKVPIGTQS